MLNPFEPLMPPFGAFFLHVEGFAAAAWPDAEEIGVVGHLHLALLAGYVYTHRESLAVGVECGERRVLAPFEVFLEEQAQCRVRQREEQVIVGIEAVGAARKGVDEQLQLVVGCA